MSHAIAAWLRDYARRREQVHLTTGRERPNEAERQIRYALDLADEIERREQSPEVVIDWMRDQARRRRQAYYTSGKFDEKGGFSRAENPGAMGDATDLDHFIAELERTLVKPDLSVLVNAPVPKSEIKFVTATRRRGRRR
jgi:hypothetical protein